MTLALEQVQPQVQKALAAEQIVDAMGKLDTIATYDPKVMTDADLSSLVDLGTLLGVGLKMTEAQERAVFAEDQPLGKIEAGVKAMRAKFLDTRKALKAAVDTCRDKVGEYKRIASQRALDAEIERQRAAAEAAAQQEQDQGIPLPPVDNAVEAGVFDVPAPANKVVAGVGTATSRRMRPLFTITDVVEVARRYPHLLVLDQAKCDLEHRAAVARKESLVGISVEERSTESFGRR